MDYELLRDIAEMKQAGTDKKQQAIGKSLDTIAHTLERLENDHGEQAAQSVLRDLVAAAEVSHGV